MSNLVNIEMPDGEIVEVDAEVLKGYKDESFEILKKEAEAKADLKAAIEAQAEGMDIPKKYWAKYLKAAFKAATKEQSALGKTFDQLDEATDADATV